MNIPFRRACLTARRLPLPGPLSWPSHRSQTSQQFRAFKISSALANQHRPSTPPRHFPSKAEVWTAEQEQHVNEEAVHRLQEKLHGRAKQKQGLLYALYVANTAVFVAWWYSGLAQANDAASVLNAHQWRDFMKNNFLRSDENIQKGRWWTNLTCGISHSNLFHFGVNMLALRQTGVWITVGMPQVGLLSFAALCIGSTLAASAGAQLSNQLTGDRRGGLGASGMVSGLIAAATCAFPQQMWMGTAMWFAVDLGLLTSGAAKFSPIGHGAHVGGSVFGVLFWLVAFRRGKFGRVM